MNIVMDAFGGDNAPLEVIKGAIDAHNEFKVDITLVGDEAKIRACAKDNGLDIEGLKLRQADDVIEICDDPKAIIKSKKNSSMAVGMKMLWLILSKPELVSLAGIRSISTISASAISSTRTSA